MLIVLFFFLLFSFSILFTNRFSVILLLILWTYTALTKLFALLIHRSESVPSQTTTLQVLVYYVKAAERCYVLLLTLKAATWVSILQSFTLPLPLYRCLSAVTVRWCFGSYQSSPVCMAVVQGIQGCCSRLLCSLSSPVLCALRSRPRWKSRCRPTIVQTLCVLHNFAEAVRLTGSIGSRQCTADVQHKVQSIV